MVWVGFVSQLQCILHIMQKSSFLLSAAGAFFPTSVLPPVAFCSTLAMVMQRMQQLVADGQVSITVCKGGGTASDRIRRPTLFNTHCAAAGMCLLMLGVVGVQVQEAAPVPDDDPSQLLAHPELITQTSHKAAAGGLHVARCCWACCWRTR